MRKNKPGEIRKRMRKSTVLNRDSFPGTAIAWAEKREKQIETVLMLLLTLGLLLTYLIYGALVCPDSEGYIRPAREFLETGRFTYHGMPILFRTPGYSLFLAIVFKLTNYSYDAVAFLQMGMTLASMYMLYDLVKKISGSGVLGCLSSLFFLCNIPIYDSAVSIMSDCMFPFLLVWAVHCFYRYLKSGKLRHFFFSSLILNYAMLVRPQIMYFNMILAVVFLVLAILKKVGLKACGIYVSLFVLLYGGWTLRNYLIFDEVTFTPLRSESYYEWYAPAVYEYLEDTDRSVSKPYFEAQMQEMHPDYENYSRIQQVHAEKEVGGSYIAEHPAAYIAINFKGLFIEMLYPGVYVGYPDVMPNNLGLKLLKCFASGMLLLSYLIYAVSFLRTLRRQKWFDWAILLLVMYLMASTAVIGRPRFRMAFYPLCLLGTFTCWKKKAKGQGEKHEGI